MNWNDSIYLTQPNSFLSRPTFVWIENIWIPKLFSYSTSRTRFNRSSRGRAVFCVHPSQLHHFKSRVKWWHFGQSNVSGIAYSMTTSNNRKYHWLCLQVQGKNSFYLARSCCHPKHSSNHEQLMTGKLGSTNQAYVMAKLTGLEMRKSYRQLFQPMSLVPVITKPACQDWIVDFGE